MVIEILRKQYEKKQLIINGYYAKLKKMQVSSTYYEKLQWTYDITEKQLLLLEALGRNIEKKIYYIFDPVKISQAHPGIAKRTQE